MTSSILWLAAVAVFTAVISGIAWANSPKARARRPEHCGQLFGAIFLSIAPWTVGIAAINPMFDLVSQSGWVEFVIVAAVIGGPMLLIEVLFQPTRKLQAAYATEGGGQ
ncbi:MAG TPA: hypothetical protein PLF78_07130 [Caulobacter sp.]|nr:hypothetical protein [Caulobacter sp.]